MKNILLDVNVIVDFCLQRKPHFKSVWKALRHAEQQRDPVWLYAGSVQTLEYVLSNELRRIAAIKGQKVGFAGIHALAKEQLHIFSRNKRWLAALSEDGVVFQEDDPEDAQLARAVMRLGKGARLLTRDKRLRRRCDRAISPDEYSAAPLERNDLPFIDLARQQQEVKPQLERGVFGVFEHGKYIMGPEVAELEKRLAEYVGVNHCIGCASGTDALLMALMAKGVGPGDAIFTTPFTFIATAEVIALLGATPVFVDINPKTFNMDPEKLSLAIKTMITRDFRSQRTEDGRQTTEDRGPGTEDGALVPKGIVTVDLFGLPCDYDRINAIADENGFFVIEDGAQGLGGEYKERKACALAEIGCTSFFPAKPLGCYGDGGAVFTDDDGLAEIMGSIRVHGKGTHKYDNARIGLNARLDTIQAAILLAKFDIFSEEIELRQKVAQNYTEGLSPNAMLSAPCVPDGYKSAWAQFSVLAESEERKNGWQGLLKENGVPTAVYYPKPLHLQSAFSFLGYKEGDFPVSEDCSRRIFSLPMHPYLSKGEIERICDILKKHGSRRDAEAPRKAV